MFICKSYRTDRQTSRGIFLKLKKHIAESQTQMSADAHNNDLSRICDFNNKCTNSDERLLHTNYIQQFEQKVQSQRMLQTIEI